MRQYLINDLNISKNIVQLRKEANMTQDYVAIQLQTMGLNISRSRLSMIELGRLNIPVSMLVALKIIFKCDYFKSTFYVAEDIHQSGVELRCRAILDYFTRFFMRHGIFILAL